MRLRMHLRTHGAVGNEVGTSCRSSSEGRVFATGVVALLSIGSKHLGCEKGQDRPSQPYTPIVVASGF